MDDQLDPALPADATIVERSVELPVDTAAALRSLTDPDRLSLWLGRWQRDADGDVVTTDDGVRRRVTDLSVDPCGVRWRWRPESDRDREGAGERDGGSTVEIEIRAIDPARTLVIVREHQASATTGATSAVSAVPPSAGLDAITWTVCLLVLEIAAATPSLITS